MHHRVSQSCEGSPQWSALPILIEAKRELPDYLPARMVNEFAYCPRLFFYEWVEGLFAESVDTVEGAIQHRRVDAKATALPDAAGPAAVDPLAQRDAIERAAARDREDGPGRGRGRRGDAGGLQARASARGRGRAGVVAERPGAVGGPGDRAAGERVPVRGRRRVLPQDGAAGAGDARRGADRGDGGADSGGVGRGGIGRDSGAAGGFAEVSGVLAGGDLPAGRDVAGGGGGDRRSAATGAVRRAAAQAGEARGAADDDAAERTASAVSEHARE